MHERELARARHELEQARGSRKVRGEAADFDEMHQNSVEIGRKWPKIGQNGPILAVFGSFWADFVGFWDPKINFFSGPK